MNRYTSILITCLALIPVSGISQEKGDEGTEEALPPPDLPDSIQSGEPIEPEITIIRKKDAVVQEYRINGNLYMVKITPSAGPPYYLIDQDGDGRLESRRNKLGSDVSVPQWVLFSW